MAPPPTKNNEEIPDFSLPRWDQGTYLGRLKHFSALTDPRNLITSLIPGELERAKGRLAAVASSSTSSISEEEKRQMWKDKYLLDSTYHPQTGQEVFLPFRMASFVPTNVPIIALMLIPNPSSSLIIASQWINQSANVAFNFYNANKSVPMSTKETATAYAVAVTSSVSLALGLNWWVTNRSPPKWRPTLLSAVPFAAVSLAGTVNVFMMRGKELTVGIDVTDEDGKVLGKSKVAGYHALSQVSASRIATAAPALFLPGLIMARLQSLPSISRRTFLHTPLNLACITGCLMLGLPAAIAIFPGKGSLKIADVETEIRTNNPGVEKVYFNRGL